MAGSTSDISIKVVANAAGVDVGLKKAERAVKSFGGKTRGMLGDSIGGFKSLAGGIAGVGSALTGLSVGGGIAGFAAGLKSAIERLDDLGDRAKGIDTSITNLSELEYIAERVGSSGEAAANGVKKMEKALGEAATKGGPAADTIAALGLNIDSLTSGDPVQTFLDISQAIGELPNVYDRAAAAQAIFGKSAGDLMQFFKDPEEINKFSEDFLTLHGDIEAAGEQAGAVKDQMDRLSEAVKGVGEQFVIAFGPDTEKMIRSVADALGSANTNGLSNKLEMAKAAVGGFLEGTEGLGSGLPGTSLIANKLGGMVLGGILDRTDQTNRANAGISNKDTSGKKSLEAAFASPEFQKKAAELAAKLPSYDSSTTDGRVAAAQARANGEYVPRDMKAFGDYIDSLSNLDDVTQDQEKAGQSLADAFEALKDSTEDVVDAQKDATTETPGYSNLSVTGGDMPGMFSDNAAYDRFMQYNTLPGGYVGNLAPNIPSFTPPEWGSRQAGPSAYGDAGYGMDTNNELLNTIARNTRDQGVYA